MVTSTARLLLHQLFNVNLDMDPTSITSSDRTSTF